MSGRKPDVWVNSWRIVIVSFPSPTNSGMYFWTVSSSAGLPRSIRSITAGVHATTLVNDAASKIVSVVIISRFGTKAR